MADPFLGEIRIVSFSFAPKSWALCNGQLLPINQNQALFSLLGTMYGGNGVTTFALPNFRGRVPVHRHDGGPQGTVTGAETVTLSVNQLPAHIHVLTGSPDAATANIPTGNAFAKTDLTFGDAYAPPASLVAMAPDALRAVGGTQPHQNMQPFLTLNFVIALVGIFPSRN